MTYFDINEAGFSVRCKLFAADKRAADRVIICCHGFGGSKDSHAIARFADRVLSKYKSVAVIAFEWPCHGQDARKALRLDECFRYLDIVTAYAKQRFQPRKLFAYGTSFGGYLLLNYMLQSPGVFEKIALRCPAINIYESLTTVILSEDDRQKLHRGKDVLAGFDRKIKLSPEALQELSDHDIAHSDAFVPYADKLLILHGTKDEIISFDIDKAFSERNGIPFLAFDGADHRFSDPVKMDAAIHEILRFFSF